MENLVELRNEIDVIDREIVDLFQKRMKISSEVAEYKISTGKKVFDRAREAQKIQAVTELFWRKPGLCDAFPLLLLNKLKNHVCVLFSRG